MASKLVGVAVAVGLLVLFIGVMFPTLITAPDGDTDRTATLNESESIDTEYLTVSLDNVDNDSVTVKLRDTTNQDTVNTTVGEGENESVTLSGETIDVTVQSVTDGSNATVTVSYPSTFGWSGGASLLAENLGILLVILAFVIVVGILIVVVQ